MQTRGKDLLVQKGDQRGVYGGFGFMALWYEIKYMTWKKIFILWHFHNKLRREDRGKSKES